MFIDESRTEEKLQINLDVTLPAMPCELLSFDAQDVMGSHEVDAHGNLFKERLTSKGDMITREEIQPSRFGASSVLTYHHSFSYDNSDLDRIRKMINSGEGCRVAGFVRVNKVPGNVHLSTCSHSYILDPLYRESRKRNISHRINHISFGTESDIAFIKENFQGTGVVSPLDGIVQTVNDTDGKVGTFIDSAIFEYYTKVVPTTYIPLSGQRRHVYQFTANANKIVNQQMPSLYLRYDFSPVTIQYREARESLSHFLVQVCAVIGGIFTVAGMFDAVLHRSIVHLA